MILIIKSPKFPGGRFWKHILITSFERPSFADFNFRFYEDAIFSKVRWDGPTDTAL